MIVACDTCMYSMDPQGHLQNFDSGGAMLKAAHTYPMHVIDRCCSRDLITVGLSHTIDQSPGCVCAHCKHKPLQARRCNTREGKTGEREREGGREGERELSDSEKAEYAGAHKQTKKNI